MLSLDKEEQSMGLQFWRRSRTMMKIGIDLPHCGQLRPSITLPYLDSTLEGSLTRRRSGLASASCALVRASGDSKHERRLSKLEAGFGFRCQECRFERGGSHPGHSGSQAVPVDSMVVHVQLVFVFLFCGCLLVLVFVCC